MIGFLLTRFTKDIVEGKFCGVENITLKIISPITLFESWFFIGTINEFSTFCEKIRGSKNIFIAVFLSIKGSRDLLTFICARHDLKLAISIDLFKHLPTSFQHRLYLFG